MKACLSGKFDVARLLLKNDARFDAISDEIVLKLLADTTSYKNPYMQGPKLFNFFKEVNFKLDFPGLCDEQGQFSDTVTKNIKYIFSNVVSAEYGGAKFLVESGLNLNGQCPDSPKGYTWFMYLTSKIGHRCDSGENDLLKQIIRNSGNNKVDINYQDDEGNTVLTHAVASKQIKLCKILLNECEMNIDLQTKSGATALTIAYSNKQFDIVKLLLKNKTDEVPALDSPECSALKALDSACQIKLGAEDIDKNYENLPGFYFINRILFDQDALEKCIEIPNFAKLLKDAQGSPLLARNCPEITAIFKIYKLEPEVTQDVMLQGEIIENSYNTDHNIT